MSRLMTTIGERVKSRRVQLGLSQPELARKVGGISHQAIQALEAGGGTRHVVSLARALGVSPEWLQTGTGPIPSHPRSSNHQKITTHEGLAADEKTVTNRRAADLFDVLGMVEGGPDGWNLWNGDVVETKLRPDNLIGVAGAYGVYIRGHSMEPELKHGALLHIHPHRPAQAGDFVVVQRKPIHEGDPPLAVIKRLVRRSPAEGGKTVLEQTNPKKTFEVANADIISVHVAVGMSWA